jgi:hypothetical protein
MIEASSKKLHRISTKAKHPAANAIAATWGLKLLVKRANTCGLGVDQAVGDTTHSLQQHASSSEMLDLYFTCYMCTQVYTCAHATVHHIRTRHVQCMHVMLAPGVYCAGDMPLFACSCRAAYQVELQRTKKVAPADSCNRQHDSHKPEAVTGKGHPRRSPIWLSGLAGSWDV